MALKKRKQAEVKPSEVGNKLEEVEEVAPQQESNSMAALTSTESTKVRYGTVRGISRMNKVAVEKKKGIKSKVQCNEFGVPVGLNRHKLQSYIGTVVRNKIPIDIVSWPKVEKQLKANLWKDIVDTFNLPPESESIVLKSAGAKWRQFKTKLTSDYVLPYIGHKKKLRKPPKKYNFVTQEAWKRFVAERTSQRWLDLHNAQRERVGKRKYHHRLSRKGYIGLQEEVIKEGELEPGEIPDRAILWKRARSRKDSEIDEEQISINAKIDTLLEQKEKGEFVPFGTEDVLCTALETPEHSGRVRGIGGFVTPSLYFRLPKGKMTRITKADLIRQNRENRARIEELEKNNEKIQSQLNALLNRDPVSDFPSPKLSDKASCPMAEEEKTTKSGTVKQVLEEEECVAIETPNSQKKVPQTYTQTCEFAVDNLENKVAFGRVFEEAEMNELIHGKPIPPECVRVSIDGIIQAAAKVPHPVGEEIDTVQQALGSQLAWPRNLIIFPNPAVTKGKMEKAAPSNPKADSQVLVCKDRSNPDWPSSFKLLYRYASAFMKTTGTSIPIPCDPEVFGVEKTIYILHENIIALLEFDMIGGAIIASYMAHLHTVVTKNKELDLFAFVDPQSTFSMNTHFETYIVNRLKEGKADRMFFMPFNQNAHWILIIIWDGDIYILNPLPHPVHFPSIEKPLSSAIKSFHAETGRGIGQVSKITNLGGSPKQPGSKECGYVVMRYMRDIINDNTLSFTTKWAVKSRKCYTMEELDVVRSETVAFIQDKM